MDANDTKELQHICKFEKMNDDNEEFFDTVEDLDKDKTAKTRPDTEIASNRDKVHLSHKNNTETVSNESAFAFAILDSSPAKYCGENQGIDVRSASSVIFSVGSDECGQKQLVQYSKSACAGKADASSDDNRPQSFISTCLNVDGASALNDGGAHPLNVDGKDGIQENSSLFGLSFERSDSCTDACPKHCDEIIKYICISCDELACQVCISLEHINCENREFIPSFITKPDFRFGEKCRTFEAEIDDMESRLSLNKNKINSNIKGCENMKDKAKGDFKKQRDEINRLFDCLEQDFDRKIWQIENSDKERMRLLMEQQENLEKVFDRHVEDYYQRRNASHKTGVFTMMKMSREEAAKMKKDLERIEKDNTIRRYVYMPSKLVTDFTKSVSDLGHIEYVHSKLTRKITGAITISMRGDADKNVCKISGLDFLTEHLLVAIDYGNSSIKVIDICADHVLSVVSTSPAPFDVTVIRDKRQQCLDETNAEFVMTLPGENKIRSMQFKLPDSFLRQGDDIQTNGQCRGIAYSDKKLYITFPSKGKIEIIDMQGQLLNRITTETIGRFFQPQFIAMDTEESIIFVSDNENHSVISMTLDGKVKAVFTDDDLIQPRGLCVNSTGAVFVCSFQSQTVHHLSDNCEAISTMNVADEDHLTPFPFSIAYSDKKHVLYVGQFTMDCIKAYKLE